MFLIGENLNIMNEALEPALNGRLAEPVQAMARAEAGAGVDALDLNIGPARRGGDALMTWVVETVQQVTDVMLCPDTANQDAMAAGLKACKRKALINSVSLQTSRIDRGLALAQEFNADIIGLLWSNDGMPRDANERAMHTVDFVYKANQAGIGNERIWIDPIISPVCVDVGQVKAGLEFLAMLPEIAPGCKSVAGLSNVSNGAPGDLRCWLNRTYLAMLLRHGLSGAIADAFDKDLLDIARGRRPDILDLVNRLMDGEKPDAGSMPKEMRNYARTVPVLTGESVYSAAWLEV